MNIALCFCVRNCEKYLPNIFKNIEILRKKINFKIYCIFVYDNCSDNSEKLLINYMKKNKDNVLVKHINNESHIRTVRIAKARNECLNVVYNIFNNILFHIMIDSDNIGSSKWNIDVIDKYLNNFDNDNWDCISFNKKEYYDIWALLYDNFKHPCWSFGLESATVVDFMFEDITKKIQNTKSNSIEVISAFNGFCIYKTKRFKGFYYDGLYENFKKLVTDEERKKTVETLKKFNINVECKDMSLTYKYRNKLILWKSYNECCEHLYYNFSAFKKGRKIKISKFIIN